MVKLPTLDLENLPDGFLDRNAFRIQNDNIDKLRNYGGNIGAWLQGVMDGYDLRFDQQIHNSPQPSEVVDARIDVMDKVYPTLKAHLDGIETDKISGVVDKNINVARTVQLNDLSTTSDGLHVDNKKPINYTPQNEGLLILSLKNITVNKAGG